VIISREETKTLGAPQLINMKGGCIDITNYWAPMVRIKEKWGIGLERKGPLNVTQIKPQSQLKSFDCDKCKNEFFNNMYINGKCIM